MVTVVHERSPVWIPHTGRWDSLIFGWLSLAGTNKFWRWIWASQRDELASPPFQFTLSKQSDSVTH